MNLTLDENNTRGTDEAFLIWRFENSSMYPNIYGKKAELSKEQALVGAKLAMMVDFSEDLIEDEFNPVSNMNLSMRSIFDRAEDAFSKWEKSVTKKG